MKITFVLSVLALLPFEALLSRKPDPKLASFPLPENLARFSSRGCAVVLQYPLAPAAIVRVGLARWGLPLVLARYLVVAVKPLPARACLDVTF